MDAEKPPVGGWLEPCPAGGPAGQTRQARRAGPARQAGPGGPGGPCGAGDRVDLTGLDEATRRKILVEQAARFTMAFSRWTDVSCSGGLTYQQVRLLDKLRRHGPAIMRELGGELGISPRNMTATVDALEQAHLVERRPHPSDRRATLIDLTAGGAATAGNLLDPRIDAIAEVFAGFSAEEQQRLYTALTRLVEAMRASRQAC